MLRACVAAAERGVRVRVLLPDAWYVSDENRALVAALNDRAARENREVAVAVESPAAADYFARAFAADWRGGSGRLPIGLAGAVVAAAALAVAVGQRRVAFTSNAERNARGGEGG